MDANRVVRPRDAALAGGWLRLVEVEQTRLQTQQQARVFAAGSGLDEELAVAAVGRGRVFEGLLEVGAQAAEPCQ